MNKIENMKDEPIVKITCILCNQKIEKNINEHKCVGRMENMDVYIKHASQQTSTPTSIKRNP